MDQWIHRDFSPFVRWTSLEFTEDLPGTVIATPTPSDAASGCQGARAGSMLGSGCTKFSGHKGLHLCWPMWRLCCLSLSPSPPPQTWPLPLSLVFASWARTRGALHGVLAELQYRCPEIRGNQIKFHWLWPLFFTINHRPPVVSPQFSAFDYGHSGALLLHSAATPSTAGHNPVIERIRSATVCWSKAKRRSPWEREGARVKRAPLHMHSQTVPIVFVMLSS